MRWFERIFRAHIVRKLLLYRKLLEIRIMFLFSIDERWTLNTEYWTLQLFSIFSFRIFHHSSFSLNRCQLCSAFAHENQNVSIACGENRKWALIERLLLTPCVILHTITLRWISKMRLCVFIVTIRLKNLYAFYVVISTNKQ